LALAKLISQIFTPIKEVPAILYFLALVITKSLQNSQTNINILNIYLLTAFLLYILPWIIYLILIKAKILKNKGLDIRKERLPFFVLTFIIIILSLIFISIIYNQSTAIFYLKYLSPLFVFFTLTFIDKISGHGLSNTYLFTLIYLNLTSMQARIITIFLGIIIISAVGWSRIFLKKHNLRQVIIGSALPLLIYFFK
jgi:membrane-associated phospholipid phosphatase